MPVVGRESEQAQLEQALFTGRDGPRGLLLEGEPGIGKSTLWAEAVAGARSRGYRVIATTPGEHDGDLAFAGLGDLLEDLDDEPLSALPDPQRRALSGALYLSDDPGGAADGNALPRAVLSLLRTMARDVPLMVAIDDEQWLDPPSRRVLAFALGRLRDEAICSLIARRPVGDDDLIWPAIHRPLGDEHATTITVAPLPEPATARLIAEVQSESVARPVVRRIHKVSGGNPLYALALARELPMAALRDGGELRIPTTLKEAMARRLDGLGSRSAEPMLVMAACGEPPLSLIRDVLPDFTADDLDEPRSRGIVELSLDHARFTHPLLASAVYTGAPADRRRAVHRQLAAHLDPTHEEHAHHLARGAERPERGLAAELEKAAETAAARGAPEVAAGLLEHAIRLTPPESVHEMWARRVACAERYFESGDQPRARAMLEPVIDDVPPGELRARALWRLALVRRDDFDAAAILAREALTEAGDHDALAIDIEALLTELCSNGGDQAGAVRYSDSSLARAERLGDPGLLCEALSMVGLTAFFSGQGVRDDLMGRAAALEDQAGSIASYELASCKFGCQLLWSDEPVRARPFLVGVLERAEQRGEEYDRDATLFHLAHLEWEAGDVAAAHRYTEAFIEATQQQGDEQAVSYLGWLRAYMAARRGDQEETARLAREAIEVACRIGDAFIESFSTALLAGVDLAQGRAEQAHERTRALREALVGQGQGFIGSLTLNFWTTDIEALIALGRLNEAALVLVDLRERATSAGNPNALALAHRLDGLLAAATGDVDSAIASMQCALDEHARRPLPIEVGRTLLEKGSLERRARRKGDAKRSLEQARDMLDRIGADALAERAADGLQRVGLRRAADPDGLTPAQMRVAELVASGLTNREIGAELYMSVRTVETHLTKIYRELGIRSRAQLAGALAAREGSGE